MYIPKRDWIVQTSMTTGLGDFQLAAEPPVGTSYFPFRHRFGNGATVPTYWVVNDSPTAKRTKWEKYRAETLTYGPPLDELSRNNLEASTNDDGPVNWQSEDLPLLVYIVPDDAAVDFAVTMGLGSTRPPVLRYGMWAKSAGLAANFDQLRLYDSVGEGPVGVVNRVTHEATIYGLPPGHLYGLTISRSSASVLGIAAGIAMDSDNEVGIRLASAWTKSTAGAWTAGSGQNGMGQSLTVANNTWYHVFLILNNGVADVYFDTSASAANKPAGTTHFLLIDSFKTDGSAQIIDFIQTGDEFEWVAPVTDVDVNSPDPSGGPQTRTLPSVPTGYVVEARVILRLANTSAVTAATGRIYPLGLNAPAFQVRAFNAAGGTNNAGTPPFHVRTNTAAQINSLVTGIGDSAVTLTIYTVGWRHRRGKDG